MDKIRGKVTGIGSLPYKDPETALELIFKYAPDIPFWPQLPQRDPREAMVAQFSEGMPCIKFSEQGVVFNPANIEEELERFYQRLIAAEAGHFKISRDYAAGLYAFKNRLEQLSLPLKYIKGHITGPFSFAASVKDDSGRAMINDKVFLQAIVNALAMKAVWQARFLKGYASNTLIFIDEPYLGCFGSAYTPLNRQEAVRALIELTERVAAEKGVIVGVHCCGNTDWSIFTDVADIKVINFDSFNFWEKFSAYPREINGFLARGGCICWGIVPTAEFDPAQSAASLVSKVEQAISGLVKKGVSRDLLYERLLVSPACGLGTVNPETAQQIFQRLSEVSRILKNTR